ncbi:MAG: Tim44/TimA family putative adaptor protein [Alphaproteobacteria bacterium]
MTADLIVYALVAAGLVFWLRSILGTRHGEERQREVIIPKEQSDGIAAVGEPVAIEDRIKSIIENTTSKVAIDKAAESGLVDISHADREFDIDFFIQGAQDAFAMIVESFAAGDRASLKDLLGDSVYAAFEGAITEREKRREKQQTQIRAIRKAEIVEAMLRGRMASITLRFTADEVSVTRDEAGAVIDGHPEKLTVVRDVWTFMRDIKSRDPRWMVVETRGDFEGDNNYIPNTH